MFYFCVTRCNTNPDQDQFPSKDSSVKVVVAHQVFQSLTNLFKRLFQSDLPDLQMDLFEILFFLDST